MSNFYENIKSIRISKKLTQAVMSEKLDITEVHYNRIENDKVDISLSKMNKLAEIFGMTVIEIMQYSEGVESVKVDSEKVKELENRIKELEKWLEDKESIISLMIAQHKEYLGFSYLIDDILTLIEKSILVDNNLSDNQKIDKINENLKIIRRTYEHITLRKF